MSVTFHMYEPGIGLIRVNRPQARNALNWETMRAFSQCVEDAHQATSILALVVAGGKDIFIAGGDLKELSNYSLPADGRRLSHMMSVALERLSTLPCPTIAAMNGPARGGGAEISLACDLRVMAEDADLGLVQISLGLTPGWGAGQRLLRLVGYSLALEWLATGRILTAQQALAYGLANRVSSPGQALESALDLARQIAAQPGTAIRAIKRLLRAGIYLSAEGAAAFEQSEFPDLWAAEDHLQAVRHFLERK